MAYNKKHHLRDNIEAIRTVFNLDKGKRRASPEEHAILNKYSGFGGLKCILNPVKSLTDAVHWTKSDLNLFLSVRELHKVIHENAKDRNEYRRYFNSLKNSVLTSFYTPPEVVRTMAGVFSNSGINSDHFLDPSAGMGEFISAFKEQGEIGEVVGIEKDLLTGKMLSCLYPDNEIRIEGFEGIGQKQNGYFDLVTSNIPFGDIAVFDPAFHASTVIAEKMAVKSIHNYFFLKAVTTLREGGILAFITSQGVMDSPQNQPIRNWLMGECSLVSAVRLPNNLFSDYAGTEVGSDLVVLQKNGYKERITGREENFIHSHVHSNGIATNDYFQNMQGIVHTEGYVDTDPYGKPAWIYEHEGGIKGIADNLRKMLTADLSQYLDVGLFNENKHRKVQQAPLQIVKDKQEEITQGKEEIRPNPIQQKQRLRKGLN